MDSIAQTLSHDENEDSHSLTNDLVTQMHSRISVMSKSIMTRFEDMDDQFDLLEKKIDDLIAQAKAGDKQQGSSNFPTGAMVATSRVISQHEYTSPKVVTPKGHRRAGSFSRRCEV